MLNLTKVQYFLETVNKSCVIFSRESTRRRDFPRIYKPKSRIRASRRRGFRLSSARYRRPTPTER